MKTEGALDKVFKGFMSSLCWLFGHDLTNGWEDVDGLSWCKYCGKCYP